MEFDNTGTVSMWKNEGYQAGGDRPWVKGKLFAHRDIAAGEEIELSLWINKSDHPKAPKLKGKVQDKWEPTAPVAAPMPAMIDDDIPF